MRIYCFGINLIFTSVIISAGMVPRRSHQGTGRHDCSSTSAAAGRCCSKESWSRASARPVGGGRVEKILFRSCVPHGPLTDSGKSAADHSRSEVGVVFGLEQDNVVQVELSRKVLFPLCFLHASEGKESGLAFTCTTKRASQGLHLARVPPLAICRPN